MFLSPGGTDERKTITFIKEGARPFTARASAKSKLLQATSSWEMRVDVGRSLQFPEVVHTALRPDIVLWSAKDCKIPLNENICCMMYSTMINQLSDDFVEIIWSLAGLKMR